jgi:hypothetical protein
VDEAEVDAFRRAAHALVDGVADYLAALPSRPVWQPVPDAVREELLGLALPERGVALDDLVATTVRDVLPRAMGNGHPAFFGWVNPPSAAGVVASLAAAAMNPSVVGGDHADVHLERAVVRWLAELVGFPHAHCRRIDVRSRSWSSCFSRYPASSPRTVHGHSDPDHKEPKLRVNRVFQVDAAPGPRSDVISGVRTSGPVLVG